MLAAYVYIGIPKRSNDCPYADPPRPACQLKAVLVIVISLRSGVLATFLSDFSEP